MNGWDESSWANNTLGKGLRSCEKGDILPLVSSELVEGGVRGKLGNIAWERTSRASLLDFDMAWWQDEFPLNSTCSSQRETAASIASMNPASASNIDASIDDSFACDNLNAFDFDFHGFQMTETHLNFYPKSDPTFNMESPLIKSLDNYVDYPTLLMMPHLSDISTETSPEASATNDCVIDTQPSNDMSLDALL
jgi:hypothetical protein